MHCPFIVGYILTRLTAAKVSWSRIFKRERLSTRASDVLCAIVRNPERRLQSEASRSPSESQDEETRKQ